MIDKPEAAEKLKEKFENLNQDLLGKLTTDVAELKAQEEERLYDPEAARF